jgi:aldehyde:ferredoxin oxidoreductase
LVTKKEEGSMASFTGKILDINLSNRTVGTSTVTPEEIRKFIGGSGLGARLFLSRVSPQVDPLSENNTFFLMAGPLSGTNFPTSSRVVACFKSPLTGIWGQASAGGSFAAEIKRAGFDGIAISGKSNSPVYLVIENDKVEFKDASDLWGKDCYQTTDILKERHGARFDIVEIGPAGENLVKIANVMNGKWGSLSRCGSGAVLGSKKLKAIVIRGTGKITPAMPDEFEKARKMILAKVKDGVQSQALRQAGTALGLEQNAVVGTLPVKNFTSGDASQFPAKIGGTAITQQYLTKPHACLTCPIACKRTVKVAEGPYAIEEGPGPQYETVASLGSLLLIDNLAAIIKMGETANRYGVDTISCGVTIAFAMECFEKGLITSRDLDGGQLRWGNPEDVLTMMEKIAYRRGFGAVLAEGSRNAAKKIGRGAEEYAMQIKGLEFPMYDIRGSHGHGLSFMTSNRGACHVASTIGSVEQNWVFTWTDIGITGPYDPKTSEGKGELNVVCENLDMLTNSVTMCRFALMSMAISDLVEAMRTATGFDYTLDGLLECGARIWMLLRGLNNLMGVTAADDTIPRRFLTPHTEGGAAGSVPNVELMLRDYYKARGLDAQGRPLKEKLISLGLSDLAAKLYK